jgi:hypothetical protein
MRKMKKILFLMFSSWHPYNKAQTYNSADSTRQLHGDGLPTSDKSVSAPDDWKSWFVHTAGFRPARNVEQPVGQRNGLAAG